MTQSEFIEATSRLETYFDKEYTTGQSQEMFKELKDISVERYRQLVTAVMRKGKFLPKIADFVEANIQEPFSAKRDDLQKIDCKKCNGTGYLVYTKVMKDGDREFKNQYASVCNCGNAKKYEGWKVTDKRYRSDYYTPLVQELGIGG